ncbi:beta-galactosidase [Zhihengliuella salsuginis]|uniref:Beta-galactosidase n=1 Tax=Zhihengliuella salsuginis TaxID=578222 RepID=A0ABQ3G9U9_9MICC|nr:beta-galactosidase [Zhihengliuella salsuginis]GHC98979.1 beta-galactosidase [Zhihengliuella salsuginis]
MTSRWLRRPEGTPERLSYGADYNPEQWPREVWDEDVRLMREADVDVVSLAIFSWARIQPADGTWDFEWLDEIMDLLHANGIGVDLATATASPPPWLAVKHPEILPVTADGRTLWQGGRQHWRPTSPVFRRYALELVEALARRYRDHPALVAWHVNNELGCHNAYDYSDDAAAAFRRWLRERYATVEALNHAWGTDFWSQRYSDFEHVLPPRLAASYPNPTQQLDFARFSSDALKDHFVAERDLLRSVTPDVPVTTNFMVVGDTSFADYADFGREVDFVSNDHYRLPVDHSRDELSFSAAWVSGVASGDPWFLMEHSTSAVNWQPVNRPKRPGELERDSLAHVAHGADAVCYFQWRQSAAGAEKYHSAMVPHAGPDSRLFRDVVALGKRLGELSEVAGSRRAPARVAILVDWTSWRASELDSHPSENLRYRDEAFDWWLALVDAGVRADVVHAGQDFSGYDVVIAPVLYSVPDALAEELAAYAAGGGHLVTTYFSGIVDQDDRVRLGGYPGVLRELLGIRVEEFRPLHPQETVDVVGRAGADVSGAGDLWSEVVDLVDDATGVVAAFAGDEELDGRPAVTRRAAGAGSASYVATRLDAPSRAGVLAELLARAGVEPELPEHLRGAVEVVVRRGGDAEYAFYINRTDEPLDLTGVDGDPVGAGRGSVLAARGVEVRRRA